MTGVEILPVLCSGAIATTIVGSHVSSICASLRHWIRTRLYGERREHLSLQTLGLGSRGDHTVFYRILRAIQAKLKTETDKNPDYMARFHDELAFPWNHIRSGDGTVVYTETIWIPLDVMYFRSTATDNTTGKSRPWDFRVKFLYSKEYASFSGIQFWTDRAICFNNHPKGKHKELLKGLLDTIMHGTFYDFRFPVPVPVTPVTPEGMVKPLDKPADKPLENPVKDTKKARVTTYELDSSDDDDTGERQLLNPEPLQEHKDAPLSLPKPQYQFQPLIPPPRSRRPKPLVAPDRKQEETPQPVQTAPIRRRGVNQSNYHRYDGYTPFIPNHCGHLPQY
jgi:hypothetical protein